MTATEILTAQLADPFRIALLIGLVLTQRRTAAATGTWAPLAAGLVFVAVIIPVTMGTAVPLAASVGLGLVANLILLIPVLAVFALWDRRSG